MRYPHPITLEKSTKNSLCVFSACGLVISSECNNVPHSTCQMEIFQLYGCRYKRKKGSHHILTHPNAKRAVVIPEYDEIDIDIIKNNMRTVGMSRDEYFELLKQI